MTLLMFFSELGPPEFKIRNFSVHVSELNFSPQRSIFSFFIYFMFYFILFYFYFIFILFFILFLFFLFFFYFFFL